MRTPNIRMSSKQDSEAVIEHDSSNIVKALQLKYIYEMVTDITRECFERCITKLHDRLDSHQQSCVEQCSGRMMDVKAFIANKFLKLHE